MGQTSPEGGKRSGAKPAHSSAHKPQGGVRAAIIGGGTLLVAALATVAIVGAWRSGVSASISTSDNDLRTARITHDNGDACAQQVFDNQTGRMMRSSQPCETTTYDSNGAPIPIGTIHRLDAISKGFGGR